MSQDSISSGSDDVGFALRGEYFADDPYVFEVESSPWEIIATPIDASPFQHWKHYLITPSLVIYRESYKSAVRLRGLAPAGMLGGCPRIGTVAREHHFESEFSCI